MLPSESIRVLLVGAPAQAHRFNESVTGVEFAVADGVLPAMQRVASLNGHGPHALVLAAPDTLGTGDWRMLAAGRLPVIALCLDERAGEYALASGADDYLLASEATAHTLARFVRAVVRGRAAPTPTAHGLPNRLTLATAVEHSPSSIVITDADGHVEYVNPRFTALTGYTLDEVRGQTMRILKSGHTSGEEYTRLWQTIKSGREWRGEFHNKKKNGELYWETASISPVTDAQGHITHFVGVKLDITERKRIEVELQQSHALREAMFERHSAVQMLIDADTGAIVDANPAACRYYGYDHAALTSMGIQEINTSSPDEIARQRQLALREKRSYFMFKHRLADGSIRDVEVRASPVTSGERNLLFSIIHDVSDRMRAEEQVRQLNHDLALLNRQLEARVEERTAQLRQANADLQESERSKDRFVSLVNHELRTPLTALQLSLESLAKFYDRLPEEKRVRQLQAALQQTGTLTELVNGLLDLSRAGRTPAARSVTRLNPRTVVEEVAAELGGLMEQKHQQFRLTHVDSTDLALEADLSDLRSIWRNLIGNASKYTPDGGHIAVRLGTLTIAAEGKPLPDAALRLSLPVALSPGVYFVAQVEDSGYGIPPADLPHLFTPFYRGWASSGGISGTGLGLSVVKETLARYGGDIAVTSEIGRGSTFTVYLPGAAPQ